MYYYSILYYTLPILLIFFSSFPSLLFYPHLFCSLLLFSSILLSFPLFYSSLLLPNLLPSDPNHLLLFIPSSSSLPILPLPHPHSKYTCRVFHLLIYIPAVSNLSKQLSMNIKRNTHLSHG